jgi:hypothetical protein
MTSYTHKNKELLNRIERIDITDYIQDGITHLRSKGYGFSLDNAYEYNRLKELLNDPKNTTFKSMKDIMSGFYHWDTQEVECIPANRGNGNGFIFYFRCNNCMRRVKFLYEYNSCDSPLCRTCCGLKYTYPSKKGRGLSRMLRKPYLSDIDKQWIIKYAGITTDDVVQSNSY